MSLAFGRLRVVSTEKIGRRVYCTCLCECGAATRVRNDHLISGRIKSCGCLARLLTGTRSRTHGMSKTPEFITWSHMKQRCQNPKDKDFYNYGARGISVCARWSDSFIAFVCDMGLRPSPLHSIERRDNSKGYDIANCRWGTKTEQSRNRTTARRITANGTTLGLSEWAEKTGMSADRIRARIDKLGWSNDRAVDSAWGLVK